MHFSKLFAAAALTTITFVGSGAAQADHTSKCRLIAVEGYTGGPSVIRMISPDGRPCAIPHYTVNCTRRHVHQRVYRTKVFHSVAGPHQGRMGIHGNRVSYRGQSPDSFAYKLTDRAGHTHRVRVIVARR